MDVSVMSTAIATASVQGVGFAKLLSLPRSYVSLSGDSSDQPPAAVQPLSSVAPPRARPRSRTTLRRRHRTRQRLFGGDDDGGGGSGAEENPWYYVDLGSGENFWYYLNPGGDGPAGGGIGFNGGGRGGGGGWNSGWLGGRNWEDPSPPSRGSSGFAIHFCYEVIHWIALSNCLHFAFKKVMKIVA